jgi:hypothetical protein|tara:strand:- start:409 stop:624 length:216 start_codon:yes stop_codon:yes gene_type:complete
MRIKERTVYDPNSEQFKYLKREKNTYLNRVDINELNRRLNKTKKSNFFSTALFVLLGFSSLTALALISIKF